MADKRGFRSQMPSAPMGQPNSSEFHHIRAPPSYEDSVRSGHFSPYPPSYYQNPTGNAMRTPPPAYPPGQYAHMYTQQNGTTTDYRQTQTAEFDAGARFVKGGSISIPPPPPGCAPSPAQLAAMQGQSVIVTKKKRSFF